MAAWTKKDFGYNVDTSSQLMQNLSSIDLHLFKHAMKKEALLGDDNRLVKPVSLIIFEAKDNCVTLPYKL